VDWVSWKDPHTRRDIVYVLLQCIPPGFAITYSALAELVGTTPRAIGAYMRSNRELIIVPCHRVVSKQGLGGFSKGVKFKEKLLKLEGALKDGKPANVIRSAREFWSTVESLGETCCTIDDDP
jgi:methylated-DNA-[protein]-cysteine S-methyltransferase